MTPHWDDIRIFLAVARSESLSGAGRILRIDPATVGRRIARLEEELGEAVCREVGAREVLTQEAPALLCTNQLLDT